MAAAGAASVAAAGAASCANEEKETASIKAKLKNSFLEFELWLPTFFIKYNDYLLKIGKFFMQQIHIKNVPLF
ncbi:hypothetical protein FGL01_06970 [Flavobacterium glycines]|uniref:Uncharacterized protein n=1 Tax=Flavobacterium glycines TaxID=551990 RepID=A0A511CI01_9FLAO|nr:hypothetical protein FGL01_06970 [Flavobacterium glycines]